MLKNTEVILGLDPGYDRLGWAVGTIQGQSWLSLHHGLIHTAKELPQADRYQQLVEELTKVIQTNRPQVAVVETLFFARNRTSAMKVSEARGVIIQTCLSRGLKIVEFSPAQIKQAVTGHGQADKKSVEKMVRLQLKLSGEKIGDDAIDALAAMLTYQVQRRMINLASIG